MKTKRTILMGAMILAVCGCDRSASPARAAEVPPPTAVAAQTSQGVVDSVFPMPVMLDRFRKGIEQPAAMTSGAQTRDELVGSMMRALQASDTTAFEKLAVSLPEWAWLYFPSSPMAQPPYELPPALAWFRAQEGNRKGVFRALRELGGHALVLQGYVCNPKPIVAGDNREWVGCTVTLSRDGGAPVTIALFGSILERDGRFAFLSYVNDF
jgi:hypothetical protein